MDTITDSVRISGRSMRISEQTAIKALALQSMAAALWIDGQEAEALRSGAEARALL